MDQDDQRYRDALLRRYTDNSATLVYGPIVRARWTAAESREAEQHWSDGSARPCLAWLTSPAVLGSEPAEVVVAFGSEGTTVTMHGGDDEVVYYWPWELLGSDAAIPPGDEPFSLGELLTPSEQTQKKRGLEVLSPCAWHVLVGRNVSTVELLLGHTLGKKDKAPRKARVLQVEQRRLAGVSIAKLDVGAERFARVDLSCIEEGIARADALLKAVHAPWTLFVAPAPTVLAEGERAR